MAPEITVNLLTNLNLEKVHKPLNRFIENLQHAINQVTKHPVKLEPGPGKKADYIVVLVFKTLIIKRITQDDRMTGEEGANDSRSLFLIYDPVNAGDVEKIKAALRHDQLQLIDQEWLEEHKDNKVLHYWNILSSCDGVVIYQGGSGEEWLSGKFKDLLKAPGFSRKKELNAIAVADPSTLKKIPDNIVPHTLETLSQKSDGVTGILKEFTKKLFA